MFWSIVVFILLPLYRQPYEMCLSLGIKFKTISIWFKYPRSQKICPCSFAINMLVTGAHSTPFDVKNHEFYPKIFGSEILPMAKQWPCKDSKLNSNITPPRSFLRDQKSASFERARSGLFSAIFPFGTALVIKKIEFENFNHIPTWYVCYRKRLLATTGPAVGI